MLTLCGCASIEFAKAQAAKGNRKAVTARFVRLKRWRTRGWRCWPTAANARPTDYLVAKMVNAGGLTSFVATARNRSYVPKEIGKWQPAIVCGLKRPAAAGLERSFSSYIVLSLWERVG